MSSAFLSLARLPLEVFTNIQFEQSTDAATVRASICNKLQKNKNNSITTVGAFLTQPCDNLVAILDPLLTYEECVVFRNQICNFCIPRPVSALALLRRPDLPPPLSTGMNSLDTCLKGGFRVQTISEIVGSAGVGKTQFAMQLCVEAGKRGIGTVYIDTERKLNLGRLNEIARLRLAGSGREVDAAFQYNAEPRSAEHHDCYKHQNQVLDNVTVHQPSTTKGLIAMVRKIEEEVLLRNEDALISDNKFPVHLLIVDSIAAHSRQEFGDSGSLAAERSALFMEIASELKRLADQLNLYVIVINQIVSPKSAQVRAALGNSWHHCLSSRVLLEQHSPSDPVRRATLIKSNVAGNDCTYYRITTNGLEDSGGVLKIISDNV